MLGPGSELEPAWRGSATIFARAVPNKVGRNSATRDADGELRSKPKNGIVPARVNGCDVKRGQFGMLCLQQRANQTFIDLDFCGWGTRLYGGFHARHLVKKWSEYTPIAPF